MLARLAYKVFFDQIESMRQPSRRIPGKRGQKSRAQKQRRAARMEKGLAHASRVEGKALKLSGSKAKQTSSKSLWVTQKGHK